MLSNQHLKARLAVLMGGMFILALIGTVFGLAWPVLTVEAGATLPPRDRGAEQADDGGDGGSGPIGAYIELQAASPPAGAWAVVQWQDSAGGWHDVEGWQGPLGSTGYQRWWVAAKDFGTGPFRWVVKQGSGGPVWGSSDSFDLPSGANETLQVSVSSG